jgi:hypothetical protein
MIERYLHLLLAFLALCAVGDESEGDDPPEGVDAADGEDAEGDQDEGGDDDGTLDDLLENTSLEGDDGELATRKPVAPAVKRERERAERAERELEIERAAARRNQPPADPRTLIDPQVEEENAYLENVRKNGDADAFKQAQWYVNQQRATRQATNASQAALRTMDDMRDLTTFQRLEVTNPKVFKRYEKRVEQALAQTRQAGQNAPRGAILRLLIGQDIMDGKVKTKSTKRAPAADGSQKVDRGALPGARTDTRRGAQSAHDKLRAKLENVPL